MNLSEMIAELQRAQRLLGDIDCDIEVTYGGQRYEILDVEAMPSIDPYVKVRLSRLI